jgi:S1-C subfamily serine protease
MEELLIQDMVLKMKLPRWPPTIPMTLALLGLLGLGYMASQQHWFSSITHIAPAPVPLFDRRAHLRSITVKILADDRPIGSGAIVARQDGWYTAITNHHVLRSRPQPWQIETFDRKIYLAQSIATPAWADLDLALLKFRAVDAWYPIANIKRKARLQIGEAVVAGGFPLQPSGDLQPDAQGFVVSNGHIIQILGKPLLEGYQIGYTNPIYKGMSGGPLLNQRSELVGINGIHDRPLWSAPSTFADGTPVEGVLQSQIDELSWAIPTPTTDINGLSN